MAFRVFADPIRLDGSGAFATVVQGSAQQAGQCAAAVCATIIGERTLAPHFGVTDPIGVGVNPDELAAAMSICEPDIDLLDVQIDTGPDNSQTVTVTVAWNEES